MTKRYACTYWHRGDAYALTLQADNLQDAKDRLRSMRANAVVDGEIAFDVQVAPSWLERIGARLMAIIGGQR